MILRRSWCGVGWWSGSDRSEGEGHVLDLAELSGLAVVPSDEPLVGLGEDASTRHQVGEDGVEP